jgi:hypothetical protein
VVVVAAAMVVAAAVAAVVMVEHKGGTILDVPFAMETLKQGRNSRDWCTIF